MTVVYILNELCGDKQHYTVIVASEHRRSIHPVARWRQTRVTSRRIDELMKVQSDWREGLRYWAVADQQLQRSSCRSQKLSAARSLVLRQASMNRVPWICARCKNVFEMSGRIDGPATGGQTPWRSDWRRHAQSTHACKRRTLTSSRGEASGGDAGTAQR